MERINLDVGPQVARAATKVYPFPSLLHSHSARKHLNATKMRVGAPFPRHGVVSPPSTIPIAALRIPHQNSVFRALPPAPVQPGSYLRFKILTPRRKLRICAAGVWNGRPLDLTEDNVRQVLSEARVELAQIFDGSVGITGEVELAELDGPFVKIGLRGRFWHKRSTVVARVGNYLKQRIPEILEVEIEDEKQLDDSPANF